MQYRFLQEDVKYVCFVFETNRFLVLPNSSQNMVVKIFLFKQFCVIVCLSFAILLEFCLE